MHMQPPSDVSPTVAPALPARLVDPWPVIAIGTLAWLIVSLLAFAVPALEGWRPISLAGLGTGALGTGIFLWQRSAARRGARGAQAGLPATQDRSPR